jgi:hypothetical protein
MWRPGEPKPMSAPSHKRKHNHNSSKNKKKKENPSSPAKTSLDNLMPLQNSSVRDTSKPILSGTIKTMKFMQRQTEAANAARAKRDRERAERERHWVIDQDARIASVSSSSSSICSTKSGPTFNFVVMKDAESTSMGPRCSLSRKSFRGFNSNVERHHIGIRREKEAMNDLMDIADNAIDEKHMANVLGKSCKVGRKMIDQMEEDMMQMESSNKKRKGSGSTGGKKKKSRRKFG